MVPLKFRSVFRHLICNFLKLIRSGTYLSYLLGTLTKQQKSTKTNPLRIRLLRHAQGLIGVTVIGNSTKTSITLNASHIKQFRI